MITDLDKVMESKGIDGLVGYGESTLADPNLTYVVGGALARGGFYFKKVGKEPLLVVSSIDYGSAKRLGRAKRVQTLTQWGYERLVRQHRDRNVATAKFVAQILRKEGIRGRVVLFGRNDLAKGLTFARALKQQNIHLTADRGSTALEAARDTKDKREIEHLRDAARSTSDIVSEIIQLLRNARERRGHIMLGKERATIKVLKRVIAVKMGERDLIAPEGTIFAAGRDGADPHNVGNPTVEIRKGMLIVFDIFPQAANGYWSDLTRTFTVGRADLRARRMYETVVAAQSDALDYLRAGVSGHAAMNRACDVIETNGYRTVRDVFLDRAKVVPSGFIHSLGHGVGLTIGELPYLSFGRKQPLRVGEVVTVEPGVYLPRFGGVRVEDTVLIKSKGIENLTHVEKELEIT